MEARFREPAGYTDHVHANVGELLEVHLFFKNSSVLPGYYAVEGFVGDARLGQVFFDYNGYSWFGRVEIRLNKETYWNSFVEDELGVLQEAPVKVRFVITGPLPLLRRQARAEILVTVYCSSCVA